jgi:hypothetical protein
VTNPQLAELNVAPAGFSPLFFFAATPQGFCRQNQGWITQYKAFAAYTVPRVEVQLSGGYQGLPGPMIVANYNAPLGIPFKVVQIVEPGAAYGDRMNQFDFRISKLLRFAGTRTMVGLDMYNLFNSTPVLAENQTFGPAFRSPISMLQARFFKFSAQFDW